MKYKILKNNPQTSESKQKYRVLIIGDKPEGWFANAPQWWLCVDFDGSGKELYRVIQTITDDMAEFDSCEEAAAKAEETIASMLERDREAERFRLENQWTECEC